MFIFYHIYLTDKNLTLNSCFYAILSEFFQIMVKMHSLFNHNLTNRELNKKHCNKESKLF